MYFKELIPVNNLLLKRSILVIYNLQTKNEQEHNASKIHNNVGFNSADVSILSKIAKKIKNNIQLTNEDFLQARKRMPKYWKQLMNHSLSIHNQEG